MQDNIVHQETLANGYRIEILYTPEDTDIFNPREDDCCNLGKMICFHEDAIGHASMLETLPRQLTLCGGYYE